MDCPLFVVPSTPLPAPPHSVSEVILGGYNNFGVNAAASKVFDLGEAGSYGVMVSFTFIKIDSWDSESAQLYANDVLVWSETLTYASGTHECGADNSVWKEERLSRTVDLGWIATDTLTLKWTTTLNSAANDESWGLTDVDVYTYDACDAVPYQSDFKYDGTTGYYFIGATAATSLCNTDTLLGGYQILDYTDEVHKLVDLPMHTSMQVGQ
jgi:hypothetical protein